MTGSDHEAVAEQIDDEEAVYRRHASELIRYATVLLGPDDAQDVVSAAFMRVLSSRRWPMVDNQRAYLFRAVSNEAKNTVRSAVRRRAREATQFDRDVNEPIVPRPDVRAAIEDLSVRQRAVVYLTYWEDMTDEMAAAHLGINAGSVRRLARARDRLREVLDE